MTSPAILQTSTLTPDFRWNPALGQTGRYIDKRGRAVAQSRVIGDLENVTTGLRAEMLDLSRQLQSQTISLAEWQVGMRDKVKIIHNAHAAAQSGGWAQMTQGDWGAVGAITKKQYAFLQNFAIQIENGLPLGGNFLRRSMMYADAARGTGQDMLRRKAGQNGFTEERRILNPADHCPDCVEFAARGWQPLGSLPRISDSICRTNCKCEFEFR